MIDEPKVKTIINLGTKTRILAYARGAGFKIVEGHNYIYVSHIKCVFNEKGKLLFTE